MSVNLVVFIGRFEPPHNGHIEVMQSALVDSNTHLLVLIGSCNQPRTPKNPWTFEERSDMIFKSLPEEVRGRVDTHPLNDYKYNDQQWAARVQSIVDEYAGEIRDADGVERVSISIIGHIKDESSYYLKMFPQWTLVEHPMNENINATEIREIVFENRSINLLKGVVSPSTLEFLESFRKTDTFTHLQREYEMIKAYKKAWEAAPYPPIFVTVDAVVIQSGHVLLVKRRSAPGKGLWAMPGGFLNQSEWIVDGMVRELREETKLKVPTPVLKGSIKHRDVFDRPDRSERGRTITHAFLIELPNGPLPVVKGSDDAEKASWIPISDLRSNNMFEDHYHVISSLLGKL